MLFSMTNRFVIFLVLVACNMVCMGSEEADRLKIIAESTLANRMAFPFIDCRFVLTHRTSDNEKDILASNPQQVKLQAEGTWIVRKDQVRHELIIDPAIEKELQRKAIESQIKIMNEKNKTIHVNLDMKFTSRKILWDGTGGMSYSPMLSAGGLMPPGSRGPGITLTPFDLIGMMGRDESRNPGVLIEGSKTKSNTNCRFEGVETLDGRDLLVVSCDETFDRENVHSKYWFDPQRGFLPVQMTKQSDNPKENRTKVMVTGFRECSGGRWFPMRLVKILTPGPAQTDKEIDVFELTVKQLDVDAPPSDDILALDIPKGARLHNSVDPQSQSTLQQPQRFSIADLGGVKEDMSKKVSERRTQHEQMERSLEKTESNVNWIAIVVYTALIVIVAGILWLRHRSKNADTL